MPRLDSVTGALGRGSCPGEMDRRSWHSMDRVGKRNAKTFAQTVQRLAPPSTTHLFEIGGDIRNGEDGLITFGRDRATVNAVSKLQVRNTVTDAQVKPPSPIATHYPLCPPPESTLSSPCTTWLAIMSPSLSAEQCEQPCPNPTCRQCRT